MWSTPEMRMSTWRWAGTPAELVAIAFPWLLSPSPDCIPPCPDGVPADVLLDGARVAAILDIRQMLGSENDLQEALTRILVDHDLRADCADFLLPGPGSPLWQLLPVPGALLREIRVRIEAVQCRAAVQCISWRGGEGQPFEIFVGRHRLLACERDVRALDRRWALDPEDPQKPLEIARLLALYGVLDNPLSGRRSGIHLAAGKPAERHRGLADYELFASPLNAALPNGFFASKWPHLEWRFGSMGSYPAVLQRLPPGAVVSVNPPFTQAYLADVMARLPRLKSRFRLRVVMPIKDAPWRKDLCHELPSAKLFHAYYDASADCDVDIRHPTLLWEDPRCDLFIPALAAHPIEFRQRSRVDRRDSPPLDCRHVPSVPNLCRENPFHAGIVYSF